MSVETTIHPGMLAERMASGEPIDLVDVRTPAEFVEVHAEGARNVPLDAISAENVRADSSAPCSERPVYLLCQSGSRARQALEKLHKGGCDHVVCVEGGTTAWIEAGLPVVRGRKTISVERQVRIAAGALVALGTALGAFYHEAFLIVPGFIGAGLVFAGITDRCGMGLVLARAPWNRAPRSPAPGARKSCCS